ncbi:unnamed protein product [Brassicogethes aeneus]|uniref:D-2-hydroxyglutarate dehydrogenase, mitochondrial n=1 Tax=Brassicogethes aeneus TaxID=1431903 RepID=A0A9P0B8V8_BRAAE|nr:unnamed protein product [Brassicogethes aeneus]
MNNLKRLPLAFFKRSITTEFTKNKFKVQRGNYNYLDESHINFFRDLLGETRIIMDLSDLEKYNVDWFKQCRGSSGLVLKPKNTEEVSQILNFCNNNRLAVCPQGGNTGVVGGCTPVFDEIIISMELMDKVIDLDDTSGILVCQSGCILQNLNEYLESKNLIVPLDLGAKGSCQIGGNVSTNAGGIRLLRYGNLHGNILGLEVVTATGEIMNCMSTLKKDNTGYHLKHLFIGSEGTLGVVTKVAIQCPPKSKHVNVAFLGLENFDKVLETFKRAKQDLGEVLSAFEVLDSETMRFNKDKFQIESPIGNHPFYLLIETSGSNQQHDSEKLNGLLEKLLSEKCITNGTVATDEAKINSIWNIREITPQGYKMDEFVFCYDISVPLNHYYGIVDEIKSRMGNKAKRVFGYGHLGDANLHLQVAVNTYSQETRELLEPFLFERVRELNGSISAEHGMGFLKGKYLGLARPSSSLGLMKRLKRMFDPNGILNPYKVFPY